MSTSELVSRGGLTDPEARVFGRACAPNDPLHLALLEAVGLGFRHHEQAAVAQNVRWDERVGETRESAFRSRFAGVSSWNELWNALDEYVHENVRRRGQQDFCDAHKNDLNACYSGNDPGAGGAGILNPHLRLVTVLDLSRLFKPLQWGLEEGWRPFGLDTQLLTSGAHLAALLDDHLALRTSEEARPVVESILEILAALVRQGLPYDPTWVTTWDCMEPHLDEPPSRWLQAVGVPPQEGHWLVLLCHTVQDTGSLWRPTALEAGQEGHHFPSPCGERFSPALASELGQGGHAMDLAEPGHWHTLMPEFIHAQIPPQPQHWEAAGRRFGMSSSCAGCTDLHDHRRQHRDFLGLRYPGLSVSPWMR